MRATYRSARHILVTSPGMMDLLETRGVAREKMSLAYNWVARAGRGPVTRAPRLRDELGLEPDDFVVMYAGNLGAAQALHTAVEATGSLDHSERCHLVLVGDGVDRSSLEQKAADTLPDRIHFLGPRRRDRR